MSLVNLLRLLRVIETEKIKGLIGFNNFEITKE